VFNKTDKGVSSPEESLSQIYANAVFISAKTGENLDKLKNMIETIMCRNRKKVELELPIGSVELKEAMKIGRVFAQEWSEKTVKLKAELPESFLAILEKRQTG
jgi:50S ribosomal subunit-associated GTPase HflX